MTCHNDPSLPQAGVKNDFQMAEGHGSFHSPFKLQKTKHLTGPHRPGVLPHPALTLGLCLCEALPTHRLELVSHQRAPPTALASSWGITAPTPLSQGASPSPSPGGCEISHVRRARLTHGVSRCLVNGPHAGLAENQGRMNEARTERSVSRVRVSHIALEREPCRSRAQALWARRLAPLSCTLRSVTSE